MKSKNAGNAVVPAAKPVFVQRKIAVGAVDDPLEHEADAMADKVMRMPEPGFVQRKCAHCEEEEKKIQCKPLVSFIQKNAKGTGLGAGSQASDQLNTTRGLGNPLPNTTKSFMESRFGTDFSNVRIHADSQAASMARSLSAHAFTYGNDIYFNEGKYSPNSDSGRSLLAHELTHTIQQGGIAHSVQRDYAVEYAHPEAIAAALSDAQVAEAIQYNTKRFNLADEWEISLIRDVLGISAQPPVVDRDFVEALVQFQAENGITADGKNGPITAARLSRELFDESRGLTGRARVELLRSSRRMGTRAMRIQVNSPAVLLNNRGVGEFEVNWIVPDTAANGFIIQHVRVSGNIHDCRGVAVPMVGFEGARDYWEVWQVKDGRIVCGIPAGGCSSPHDTFQTASQMAGSKGEVTVSGRVSFFPDYLLDNDWLKNNGHPAGVLPHRASRPPFWNEGETMLHQMVITYDDCVSPATSNVTSVP